MELTLDSNRGDYQISSYEPGTLIINEKTYTQSLIITPTELIYPWEPQSFIDLKSEHFEIILAQNPEVILLGTGAQLNFPSPLILAALTNNNIGVEVMDTAAACRTFNVLAAEGRKVLGALLIR